MFAWIQGKVLRPLSSLDESPLIVGVGSEASGIVGYSVQVPHSQVYLELKRGQVVELELHTHVREDSWELFGFLSREEKELFLLLLSVNGIGPKLARTILTALPADDLIDALMVGDPDRMVKVPGVGKKTVERLFLELTEKVRKKFAHASPGKEKLTTRDSQTYLEVREALVGLGLRDPDVTRWLNETMKKELIPATTDGLIRQGLKELGG